MNNSPFCEEIGRFAKSLETKMKIEKKSHNTIIAYTRTYRDFVEFCRQHHKILSFNNIKEGDIYAFIEYKEKRSGKDTKISTSSTNSIVSHLKRLFRHIERNGDELYDFGKVFEDIKLKQTTRKPKGLTDEQVKKVLNCLEKMKGKGTQIVFRNILLFKFLLLGGLRASEAISVTLSNVSLDEESGLYKLSFKGKGDKNRFTYIQQDDIEDEIDMLKNVYSINESRPIATTLHENQMDRFQLRSMVNSIYRQCGIDITGIHILRHTAAKRLLADGTSIVVVQSILGHSSINTTAIYTNPTEDIIKNDLAKKKKHMLETYK